jgi:DNA (cytosine-5)-methyltransferase 1
LIYGSVCSGIAADKMAWGSLDWTCKFFAEINRFPSAVLAHHYGSNMPGDPLAENGIPNYGDFTKIGSDAGPIDLLVGGTPCQSFSVAGKRLGLDDPRGNLALEYLALAKRLGARWIVWENVPGVVSSVTDEEEGEGGVRSGLDGRQAGDEWIEESDFATFLSFVRECGYGFAYRVLDAQYVRVAGFPRAVPQRRQRVFVVGYLGDWRPAAAVLLEPESMRGDSPPRREAGKRVAPTISSCPTGGGGLGTDFDLDGGLIADVCGAINNSGNNAYPGQTLQDAAVGQLLAFGGNNTSGPVNVSTALQAHAGPKGRMDFASEKQGALLPIAFDTTQITSKANRSQPKSGDPCHPLASGAHAPAIAWSIMPQNSGKDFKARAVDVAQPLMAGGPVGGNQGGDYIQQSWAVRRLTPTECERLQGFPDNFTQVPYRGKPAADGPRYKALGNSMAVNAMRWIGQRIDIMEKLIKAGKVSP